MYDYIKAIVKPFDFRLVAADISAFMAVWVTCLSTLVQNYLGISATFAVVLLALLVVDFFTGISASRKEGHRISSSRGLRTLYKSGGYILFIWAAYALQQELAGKASFFGFFELSDIIEFFHIYIVLHVCFWELFSIDENLKRLGVNLGITSLLKSFYERVKNIFEGIGKDNSNENEQGNDQLH